MRIVWTETALKKFAQMMNYLTENFSEKTAKDFAQKTDKKISPAGRDLQPRPSLLRICHRTFSRKAKFYL